jgi:polysaccharide deacetylase 2 family uncharacterized protein YibQ
VVGGLGLSQTGTQKAIESLPEDVTLAFAPLGSSLQRWVEKARAKVTKSFCRFRWSLSAILNRIPGSTHCWSRRTASPTNRTFNGCWGRMTAYAGVMNYMGARFTAEDRVLAPLLGEIGARGLYYLDDGSSPASRAASVGSALEVPVVTADAIVDADRAEAAIGRELRILEETARARGTAIGVASAFPASVAAIAAWAREAEARGIVLVPVSATLRAP